MTKITLIIEGITKIIIPVFFSIVIIALPIIFEIKATFREERKENARQFLYDAQLESVKKIIEYVETAFWLTEDSKIVFTISEDYCKKKYSYSRFELFKKLIHGTELNLRSVEIHMHFIPEIKEQIKIVNEKLYIYKKTAGESVLMYDLATMLDDGLGMQEIRKTQESLQNELESFRKYIIKIYGEKTDRLINMTK